MPSPPGERLTPTDGFREFQAPSPACPFLSLTCRSATCTCERAAVPPRCSPPRPGRARRWDAPRHMELYRCKACGRQTEKNCTRQREPHRHVLRKPLYLVLVHFFTVSKQFLTASRSRMQYLINYPILSR